MPPLLDAGAGLGSSLEQIQAAVVVGVIGTIGLAFKLLADWMKRRFGPEQDKAIVEGMRVVEGAKMPGVEARTPQEQEAQAIDHAAGKLPAIKRFGLRKRAAKTIADNLTAVEREFSSAPPRPE